MSSPKKTNKTKVISFRVDERTYLKIKKKADASQRDLSKYLIGVIEKGEVVVINDLTPFLKQLGTINRNLNQLTILCHQGKIKALDLSNINQAMKKIYETLIDIKKNKGK